MPKKFDTALTPIKIGQFMRSQRIEKQLTQAELAEIMGISQGCLSKFERGLGVPSIIEWVVFCKSTDLLGDSDHERDLFVTLQYLYGDTE
jgi:DNA-binding XRE family transcriptional regulator